MSKKRLLTDGYWTRFYELVGEYGNYKTAYYKLEDEVQSVYGVNRYTSYESFKTMKSRRFAKAKQAKKVYRMKLTRKVN